MEIDVTDKVDFIFPDDESLSITKCICGKKFDAWGSYTISIYDDSIWNKCPNCGAKLYFRQSIRVYQVIDE